MEPPGMMLLHATIITIVLFLFSFIFQFNVEDSQKWSLTVGAIILVYMLHFGHELPF